MIALISLSDYLIALIGINDFAWLNLWYSLFADHWFEWL